MKINYLDFWWVQGRVKPFTIRLQVKNQVTLNEIFKLIRCSIIHCCMLSPTKNFWNIYGPLILLFENKLRWIHVRKSICLWHTCLFLKNLFTCLFYWECSHSLCTLPKSSPGLSCPKLFIADQPSSRRASGQSLPFCWWTLVFCIVISAWLAAGRDGDCVRSLFLSRASLEEEWVRRYEKEEKSKPMPQTVTTQHLCSAVREELWGGGKSEGLLVPWRSYRCQRRDISSGEVLSVLLSVRKGRVTGAESMPVLAGWAVVLYESQG